MNARKVLFAVGAVGATFSGNLPRRDTRDTFVFM